MIYNIALIAKNSIAILNHTTQVAAAAAGTAAAVAAAKKAIEKLMNS